MCDFYGRFEFVTISESLCIILRTFVRRRRKKYDTNFANKSLNVQYSHCVSDVDDAEVFEHHETHPSRLRDGRFDFGDGFDGEKFSGADDPAVRRPGSYFYGATRSSLSFKF